MDLVDRDRRSGRLDLRAPLAPRRVAPAVVEVPDHGARARRDLVPHGEGIRLVDAVAVEARDGCGTCRPRPARRPARIPAQTPDSPTRSERSLAGRPAVEVADDGDLGGVRGEDAERDAVAARRASRGASRASPRARVWLPWWKRKRSSAVKRDAGSLRFPARRAFGAAGFRLRPGRSGVLPRGRLVGQGAASRVGRQFTVAGSSDQAALTASRIIRAAWTEPRSSSATISSRPTTRRPRTGSSAGPSATASLGVVDGPTAGRDAGEVLDGRRRGIPVFATIARRRRVARGAARLLRRGRRHVRRAPDSRPARADARGDRGRDVGRQRPARVPLGGRRARRRRRAPRRHDPRRAQARAAPGAPLLERRGPLGRRAAPGRARHRLRARQAHDRAVPARRVPRGRASARS